MYRRLTLLLFLASASMMASVTQLPKWFTIPRAAKEAGVSPWMVRKEIAEGRLRARRVGRLVRVLDEELARWMRDPGAAA
jgi:excisionase family DNA binding protein